tara:strand:+ start:107 stop:1663 length:1557 start_codon:yes stop_codon:yes gene_type:complete
MVELNLRVLHQLHDHTSQHRYNRTPHHMGNSIIYSSNPTDDLYIGGIHQTSDNSGRIIYLKHGAGLYLCNPTIDGKSRMVHLVGDVFNMDTINGNGVLKFFRDRYNNQLIDETTVEDVETVYHGSFRNGMYNGHGVYTTNFSNNDNDEFAKVTLNGTFENNQFVSGKILSKTRGYMKVVSITNNNENARIEFLKLDSNYNVIEPHVKLEFYLGNFDIDPNTFEVTRTGNGILKRFNDDGSEKNNYIGMFLNNRKNGYGALKYRDRNVIYIGTFREDKFHGIGEFITLFPNNSNVQYYKGHWNNHIRVGNNETFISQKDNMYTGVWENDLRKQGLTVYNSNDRKNRHFHVGKWNDNNKIGGKGILVYKNDNDINNCIKEIGIFNGTLIHGIIIQSENDPHTIIGDGLSDDPSNDLMTMTEAINLKLLAVNIHHAIRDRVVINNYDILKNVFDTTMVTRRRNVEQIREYVDEMSNEIEDHDVTINDEINEIFAHAELTGGKRKTKKNKAKVKKKSRKRIS